MACIQVLDLGLSLPSPRFRAFATDHSRYLMLRNFLHRELTSLHHPSSPVALQSGHAIDRSWIAVPSRLVVFSKCVADWQDLPVAARCFISSSPRLRLSVV